PGCSSRASPRSSRPADRVSSCSRSAASRSSPPRYGSRRSRFRSPPSRFVRTDWRARVEVMAPLRRPAHDDATIPARSAALRSARAAIEALEDTGVDGNDIHLHGVDAPAPSVRATGRIDRRIAGNLASRTLRGALLGAVIGLALGAVLGAALMAETS